jgi:replicative DNA helicase
MKTVSLDAERNVIGSLLQNPDLWESISEIIEEIDFQQPAMQLIFRHIKRRIDLNKNVDVFSIAESIDSTGKLQFIGGFPFIIELAITVISTKNIIHHAGIVRKNRKERDFHQAILGLQEQTGNFDEKVKTAIDVLTSLSDDKKNTIVSLELVVVLIVLMLLI